MFAKKGADCWRVARNFNVFNKSTNEFQLKENVLKINKRQNEETRQ
jgi:hypothetical protein